MTESPRQSSGEPKNSRTTKQLSKPTLSTSMLIFMTALDTTWRAFLPTLGGVFLGIAIDKWLNITPYATITCLVLGFGLAGLLITQQLHAVRSYTNNARANKRQKNKRQKNA